MGHKDGFRLNAIRNLQQRVGQFDVQFYLGAGLTLVRAVHGSNGGGDHEHTRLCHELLELLWIGVGRDLAFGILILFTGENTQFTLNRNTQWVGDLNDLAGVTDIVRQIGGLLGGMVRRIVGHYRGEILDGTLDNLAAAFGGIIAMIEMRCHLDSRTAGSSFDIR